MALNVHVVVAHYNEDTSWLNALKYPHTICSKAGIALDTPANKGNEASTYLQWIIDNYTTLPDYAIFIHAHQTTTHSAGLMDEQINTLAFDSDYLNINNFPVFRLVDFPYEIAELHSHKKAIEDIMGLKIVPEQLVYRCCAQFYTSRKCLQQYTREQYQALLNWLLAFPGPGKAAATILERLWGLIFTGKHVESCEVKTIPQQLVIAFGHGLGDCSNFALQLPVYIARGYEITIVCDTSKHAVFEIVGAKTVTHDDEIAKSALQHHWVDSNHVIPPTDNVLQNNKARQNFLAAPMPVMPNGVPDELWQEHLLRQSLSFDKHKALVAEAIANLPRPLFLLHSAGNTNPGSKNMPPEFALELATQLMRKTEGSIIFLDWDNRVPWFHSGRARHITQHFTPAVRSTEGLMGLIASADLLIGVDSGPFHLAGIVDAPTIGVWFDHHPANFAVQRKNCLNIVCKDSPGTLPIAALLNTVTNETADPHFVADAAVRMVAKPRWLSNAAEDVQLATFVDKCFGRGLNIAGTGDILGDRRLSFGIALDRLAKLNYPPVIVETGCIRADNDWAGAGYSTFILGLAAERFGGTMCSIDIDPNNIAYAARACRNIPAARFVTNDSVVGLEQIDTLIDLLYLDSMDTYVDGHALHGLKEAQIGAPKVSQRGLIIFDDTLNVDGKIIGKGELAIPWLLDNGWRVLFSGYQVVLERS